MAKLYVDIDTAVNSFLCDERGIDARADYVDSELEVDRQTLLRQFGLRIDNWVADDLSKFTRNVWGESVKIVQNIIWVPPREGD